jgi:hypothetical protein
MNQPVPTMIARCGFRCHACPAFEANLKSPADQARAAESWARFFGVRVPPQKVRCRGCLEPNRDGNEYPDRNCPIAPCAAARGLDNCAACGEFPCPKAEERLRSCDEVLARFRGSVSPEDFARFLAPYDARATLQGIREGRGSGAAPAAAAGPRAKEGMLVFFRLFFDGKPRAEGNFVVTEKDAVSLFGSQRQADVKVGGVDYQMVVFEGLLVEHRLEAGEAVLQLRLFEAADLKDPLFPMEQNLVFEAGISISRQGESRSPETVMLGDRVKVLYATQWITSEPGQTAPA